MFRYIFNRILQVIPVIIGVSLLVFFLMNNWSSGARRNNPMPCS